MLDACAYVAYYRVSTGRQAQSGLGLEAQHHAVAELARASGVAVVAEYVEVESGKRDDRPELERAIADARRRKARLVVAKLDRLARNVAFVSRLMEAHVDFVAADMPHANRLTIHVLAAVAEHERDMIAQRTRDALAAARARGTRLGNPRYEQSIDRARASRTARARAWANTLRPVVDGLRAQGRENLTELAAGLTGAHVATRTGATEWSPMQVRRLLNHLGA